MGGACEGCSQPTQGTNEILLNPKHLQPMAHVDSHASNSQIQMISDLLSLSNCSKSMRKSGKKKKTENFDLKYTTSFDKSEKDSLVSITQKILLTDKELYKDKETGKNKENRSLDTLGMKEVKREYLQNLFSKAKSKIMDEHKERNKNTGPDEGNKNTEPNELNSLLPFGTASRGPPLRRIVSSSKSPNNKIDRQQFVRISHDNISDKYAYHTKIGEGGFGFVFKGYDKATKEERAIKVIKKRRLTQRGKEQALFAELDILREIDHPNIIKLYDAYDVNNTFYVVTEYCDGGQLFEAVSKARNLTEGNVAHIMTQIMSAVNYLQKKGIAHRDLKPENIVFQHKSSSDILKDSPIKIIDFGTATHCKPGDILRNQVGSPYYIAPEVIRQEYNLKCDIWSSGVIMYVLLCGHPPFRGRSQKDIFDSILRGKLMMEGGIWNKISEEAKDLLRMMLETNPSKRAGAEEVLRHKWMTQYHTIHNLIEPEVLANMEKFFFRNKFLAVIETFLAAKTLSQSDRRRLTDKFKQLDKDNSGVLEKGEMIEAYKSMNGQIDEQQIKRIIANIDSDHSGHIELTEFIVATVEAERLFKKQALENAWNFFDKDKNGFLNMEELGFIVGESSEGELRDIMQELRGGEELGGGEEQITKERFMKVLRTKCP